MLAGPSTPGAGHGAIHSSSGDRDVMLLSDIPAEIRSMSLSGCGFPEGATGNNHRPRKPIWRRLSGLDRWCYRQSLLLLGP